MKSRPAKPERGSLILLVMCLLAVLGIALASYLATSNQAMKLSNRAYARSLSRHLAESGLEEALRAFNKNDWSGWSTGGSAAAWSVSGTTATCNLTFPSTKFGQGITGSVKIRIDNYNSAQLDSAWNSTTNYRLNDYVGYSGSWYRCVRANSNQTPAGLANMAYWVPDPIPSLWDSSLTYKAQDVVYYTTNNTWYRCILAPTANQVPTNTTYWTQITKISLDNGYSSINGEVLYFFGTWYYFSNTPSPNWYATPNPPNSYAPIVSWCWRQSNAYAFNDLVLYGYPGVWYRCKTPHTSSSLITPTNATYWENALSGMSGWSSTLSYNLGDAVYYNNSWYRCIAANSNSAPSSYPAYWSAYPRFYLAWNSSKQYSQNDTVRYNGVWYLSLQNSNTGQNPATATTYWIGANTGTASYQWNASTAYSVGNYRCYGGVWYKCITANTGQSPNDTTYWTASWANSSGITTGAPVIYAQSTVTLPDSSAPIKTELRATVVPAPIFPNAAAATTTINVSGGGTVDSYDSVAGTYASQVGTSTNYSAVLAAGYTAGTAITLSSTTVNGYLAAPSSTSTPYAPLYSSGGSVKGLSSPVTPNIDLTRISRSPYIPQFDTLPGGAGGLAANWATTPKGTALDVSATTVNIGTPGATSPSRYYYNGNLTIGTATLNYLEINGPVILYVNGDLFVTASGSTGRIDINNTGSAEIHVAGSLKADVGGEGINNRTLDPKKLIVICDTASNSTQFYSDGSYPFYGVIYMPYTTNSNGFYNDNGSVQIYGAITAKKITYSGVNANIHYDTSLRYATFSGIDQPYAITEWRELTDSSEQVALP